MSDMTLTMTFRAVDEATAVMKKITEAEEEMQVSMAAGVEASSTGASQAVVAAERQVAANDHVAEAARDTAAVIIESVEEVAAAQTRGDRQWGPVEWAVDTPEQVAGGDHIQNLRDLADQQRMFREDEAFARSLIDGLGGVVPDDVANAITPPEPKPPAWSDRQWGPIEWSEDTPTQAASREEIRLMRAFADEAQAAEELQRQLAPLADTANEIADAMGGIGSNGETAAGALGAVGEAAVGAAPGLANMVAEAVKSGEVMQELGRAFGRVAGGLVAAVAVRGVEYAAQQVIGFAHEALTKEGQIAEALKNHASLVKDIDAAYRAAKDGMSEYEAASASVNAWRAEKNIADLNAARDAIRGNIRGEGVFNPLYESVGLNPWDLGGFFGRDLGPLRDPIAAYRRGDLDAVQLQSQLGAIGLEHLDDSAVQKQISEAISLLEPELDIIKKIEAAEEKRAKAQEMLAMAEQVQRSAEAGGDPQDDAEATVLAGAEISTPGAQDASAAVASGTEVSEASSPIVAAAIEDSAIAAAVQSYSALAQEASDAGKELGQVAQMTAEVEPVMRASVTGIDFATSSFSLLDPAASGAASSVDDSAAAISRAGQSAEQAAGQLLQLQEAMQSVSAARMAMTPITAGIAPQPAPANQNLPGYSGGGYTGDLSEDEIAGFVHGREFVMNAEATAIIGAERLAAIAANPEMLASSRSMGIYGQQIARNDNVRMEIAGAMAVGDTNTISVQLSAPVTITGDAPRANIEAEISAALEKGGRQIAEIIDEELRRRARRSH